jgi:branched-chain amino acid transport system permease protein
VIIVIGLLIAFGLYLLITKTRLGMRIRAGESDREMIAALGVDIRTIYTLVFALGAALAGLAGGLVSALYSVEVGMGEPVLILALVVIVIGGIGSVKGALLASILVGLVDTLGRVFLPSILGFFLDNSDVASVSASLASVLVYILMALILAIRPQGLFSIHD